MTDVRNWDRDANNNNLPPPDGAPEGQTAGSVNDCIRENMSGVKRLYDDTNGTRASTGSGGAYAITSSQNDLTAYQDGLVFAFAANHACTGAATLNVNSIGAKTIKKFHDQELVANDIESGQVVFAVYNAAEDVFQMLGATAMAALDACTLGTVTPAAATVTAFKSNGIDDQADAISITIDVEERVGIGITDPGSYQQNAQDLVVGKAGVVAGITIRSGSGNSGNLHFADGTVGNESFRGYVTYGHSTDSMVFGTSGANVATIDAVGNLGIGLTPTANMAGLSIEQGLLTIKERATPTADANYGKVYTKSDNLLYFQDGAGVEHQIAFV